MRNRRAQLALIRPQRIRMAATGCAALLVAALAAGCGPTHSMSQDASTPRQDAGSTSQSIDPATQGSPDPSMQDSSTPDGQAPGSPTPSAQTSAPTSIPSPSASSPYAGSPLPVIGHTASGGRTVALTFDDGPGPFTSQILDVLAQYNVKATFCEIGKQAAANPALVKPILAAGHRLCDHTADHPQPMHTLPHDKQAFEINSAKDAITNAGGPGTKINWFRAPGGDFTPENEHLAAQNGMRSLGWTVDTLDWTRPGVPAILDAVHQELKPGGIILMHDGGGDRSQTVAALKQLIPWLISQGYSFDFPAA